MSVLDPVSTVTVVPRRPAEDADGNKTFADLPPVAVVPALDPPARAAWRSHGERYVQDGKVFVPRGTDLIAGDEMTFGDSTFTVVGGARGDQDHPFTGEDFGWVVYTLAGGG